MDTLSSSLIIMFIGLQPKTNVSSANNLIFNRMTGMNLKISNFMCAFYPLDRMFLS